MSLETTDFSKLVKCTVISCPNYVSESGEKPRFFDFPPDAETSKIWKEKCGVSAYHSTSFAKVCADHFRPCDFEDTHLKPSAVPRENLAWMFGVPEVKILAVPDLDLVKDAVDTNEILVRKLLQVENEERALAAKSQSYEAKIAHVSAEIAKLRRLIAKVPQKRRTGARVEADLISKVFSPAQINMLMGKKVVWSYDDMAVGFTLRHVGNRECYLYLKDTLNLPLPALSAVQRWVASNKS